MPTGFDPTLDPVVDRAWRSRGMADPSFGRFLAGSSFRLSAANGDDGEAWTLWGRGATTSFSGDGDSLSHDGSVTTGTVGVTTSGAT